MQRGARGVVEPHWVEDDTGRVSALFMGRRRIAGIECGGRLAIEGTPVDGDRGLTLYNPAYDLL